MPSSEPEWKQAGFSLLETLIAVMVLGVTLVVIMQLFSGGLKAGDLSVNYTRALFIAQNEMEVLLLQRHLEDGETYKDIDAQFSCAATIVRIEPAGDERKATFDLFDITVRVMWQEGLAEKNIELNTIALAEMKFIEG